MRLLITGGSGMVAHATFAHCSAEGDDVVALTRKQLDIADAEQVTRTLAEGRFNSVINCAAWTDVDGCEADLDRNYGSNAYGVRNLAEACRAIGANLVTISTDYVFSGAKQGFYTQRDDPDPRSKYGEAKLKGEHFAREALARTIIVRSGWIFGHGGTNFLSKVVQKLRDGGQVRAIADSYGTPTFARDPALRLRELAELDLPGIYHVANSGDGTSYAGFARAAVPEVAGSMVEEISELSLRRPAPRPRNSRLRCLVSEAIGLEPLPDWRDALNDFVRETRSAGEANAHAQA